MWRTATASTTSANWNGCTASSRCVTWASAWSRSARPSPRTFLAHPDIGAAFGRLLPRVIAYLQAAGARPGMSVAVYEDDGGTAPEGEIVLHAGFDIGDQDVPDGDDVRVVDLAVLEVAAATHRGGDEGIVGAWEALVRWVDDSGYRLVGDCRELYHEWHDDDPSRNVMELQQPITR
jgi:effector-binding domain-containing protein